MGFPILEGLAGWCTDERAPLRHMMAEHRSDKLNLHLSQSSAVGLLSNEEAILLYTTVAMDGFQRGSF